MGFVNPFVVLGICLFIFAIITRAICFFYDLRSEYLKEINDKEVEKVLRIEISKEDGYISKINRFEIMDINE